MTEASPRRGHLLGGPADVLHVHVPEARRACMREGLGPKASRYPAFPAHRRGLARA